MPDPFTDRVRDIADWQPPASWPRYRVIDAHTAGEPLRIILDGWPDLGAGPILERRRLARRNTNVGSFEMDTSARPDGFVARADRTRSNSN